MWKRNPVNVKRCKQALHPVILGFDQQHHPGQKNRCCHHLPISRRAAVVQLLKYLFRPIKRAHNGCPLSKVSPRPFAGWPDCDCGNWMTLLLHQDLLLYPPGKCSAQYPGQHLFFRKMVAGRLLSPPMYNLLWQELWSKNHNHC